MKLILTENKMKSLKYFIITGLFFLSQPILAQSAETETSWLEQNLLEVTLGLALFVSLLILIVLIVLLSVVRAFIAMQRGEFEQKTEETQEVYTPEPVEESIFGKIMKGLTQSVPVQQEQKVLTDHSYDGIRELDNKLPPWWTGLFYVTIVFAVVYLIHFHVLKTGPTQEEEYAMEMEQAEARIAAYMEQQAENVDESNVKVLTAANSLASGEEVYQTHCVACHGQQGQGGVGPNFADKYWIHGGAIEDIFKTIKYGVPEKGMIAWQSQLTPKQMQEVASYIITFEGTDPPNPKEPQGELYERTDDEEENEDGEKEDGESKEVAQLKN